MLSVSELNEQAKSLLEAHFEYVEVRGEISRLTKHSSGHWYFTLKDEKASVAAVMYRMNNARLKFGVNDGMSVVIYGKVSLYGPSGSYQLIATSMQPEGEGELELAFKQLYARLQAEGLFDISHKKPLPSLPRRIALITSATSAALQDMLKVANSRWKLAEILIFDALTQGQNAPSSLIAALHKADSYGVDIIIIARGGGSREDLWCFNDETLAREIYAAKTPIISAIGHEIDYVISDFVADFRAPTPTAAMNEILPDESGVMQYLDELDDKLDNAMFVRFAHLENRLNLLNAKLSPNALKAKIEHKISNITRICERLDSALRAKFASTQAKLDALDRLFKAHTGFFEMTKDLVQVQVNGKKVNLANVKNGDEIELIAHQARKKAKILE